MEAGRHLDLQKCQQEHLWRLIRFLLWSYFAIKPEYFRHAYTFILWAKVIHLTQRNTYKTPSSIRTIGRHLGFLFNIMYFLVNDKIEAQIHLEMACINRRIMFNGYLVKIMIFDIFRMAAGRHIDLQKCLKEDFSRLIRFLLWTSLAIKPEYFSFACILFCELK